jgi:hypothetical protein
MGRKGVAGVLGVELAPGLEEVSTPYAGVSLLIELMRRCGVDTVSNRVLGFKMKGLTHGQMVECFVLLSALGGECVEDFASLRNDGGLKALLGYRPPAVETARQYLDRFHDEKLLEDRPEQGAFVPMEPSGLAGLGVVNGQVIRNYVGVMGPGKDVTLDVDAHLVQTSKREALVCYEGYPAYQPLLVSWAETGLVLADQFRDGNVPAGQGVGELVDRAYEALPAGEWQVKVRSDSAAYQWEVLDHWNDLGWQFAVSADMSSGLRGEIGKLSAEEWHYLATDRDGKVREWAELPYVPSRKAESKSVPVYRYVVARVRPAQGVLMDDGSDTDLMRHFAVVTNRWDLSGEELLRWHRGKAGTIEQVHRVVKDELAGGVYPSGKFGANAAWLRLQVLTYNLLELLKAAALPSEMRHARPKRLRFVVFTHIGKVVSHAGQRVMKVARELFEKLLGPPRVRMRNLAWSSA